MTTPAYSHTYTYSRPGTGDIIVLDPVGAPYGISHVLPSGWTVSFWYTTDSLASIHDAGLWEIFDGVTVPSGAVKVAVDVGDAPRTPESDRLKVTISSTNHKAATGLRYTASGGHSTGLYHDEYAALVLEDMGAEGILFTFRDGKFDPIVTSRGPTAVDDFGPFVTTGEVALETDIPWPGAKAVTAVIPSNNAFEMVGMRSDPGGSFENDAPRPGDVGEGMSAEMWFKDDVGGANVGVMFITSFSDVSISVTKESGGAFRINIEGPVYSLVASDPPDWAASTAYAQGDRIHPTGGSINIMECEVAGTSDTCEPTFPALDGTVVDGTVTWRHAGSEGQWHDLNTDNAIKSTYLLTDNLWHHLVLVRDSVTADWRLYLDGAVITTLTIAADNTTRGTFGTPKPADATVPFTGTGGTGSAQLAFGGSGPSAPLKGSFTYAALYYRDLTAGEILAHYDKGVELGLVV